MNTEALKKDLERKTIDVIEKGGGSSLVLAFTDAKKACIDAGISREEVSKIVDAVVGDVR